MISDTKKYVRNSLLIGKGIDNTFVVFDPEGGFTYEMDMVAHDIYRFFDSNPKTVEELFQFLNNEYSVTKDEITEDVVNVLNRFFELEILIIDKYMKKTKTWAKPNIRVRSRTVFC